MRALGLLSIKGQGFYALRKEVKANAAKTASGGGDFLYGVAESLTRGDVETKGGGTFPAQGAAPQPRNEGIIACAYGGIKFINKKIFCQSLVRKCRFVI